MNAPKTSTVLEIDEESKYLELKQVEFKWF
jgi:hypothetical protein